MDQQLFQLVSGAFGLLLTIIGVGIGWWVNTLQDTAKFQQAQIVTLMTQISQLNVELAKNYPTRAELEKTFARIFDMLEQIQRDVRHP